MDIIIRLYIQIMMVKIYIKVYRYIVMIIVALNHLKVYNNIIVVACIKLYYNKSTNLKLICIYLDEEVLVIGAGPSGMDLAYEISSVAKRLTLSHHHKEKPKTKFSSNVDQRGDVLRLTETGVEFVDGSHQTYSVIFYCTGRYKYTFHIRITIIIYMHHRINYYLRMD